MYAAQVQLLNETGLHARPASLFVAAAKKYQANVVVIKNGEEFDAKSILSILSMGAFKGDFLTITAIGVDEEEAVSDLKGLINGNFGEGEGSI